MDNVTVLKNCKNLISALENNPFDIVGLAEFESDGQELSSCLQTLYSILTAQRSPSSADRNRLAQVLYAMVAVAREDYASHGHQELWPFLFRRIQQSNSNNRLGTSFQQNQSLLGEWFRTALRVFQYSIPTEGQTNIGPVVFHSGIPRSSLPGAMQVIAAACKQHGLQAETLPVDIRRRLVENFQPALHKPLQRLLGSDLHGASQLWSCLTRVVLAWQSSGNCSAELAMLPAALDPELVRDALPKERMRGSVDRCSLSVLRYDVDTGDVRLVMPFGNEDDWSLTSHSNPLKIHWDAPYGKLTADFRTPLPQVIEVWSDVYGSDQDRTIHTRPCGHEGSEWPGIWFHAHNGNIEDGRSIDSAGLSAGRWYVLFEGTPTSCSVPYIGKTPLKWGFSTEGKDWNAFEIEIPPGTAETTFLEWRVGDNSFKVLLARRSSAKTEFTSPAVATATTTDGNRLDVFATKPAMVLRRDRGLEVLLVREIDNGLELIESFSLHPEKESELPLQAPGIYRICEARGVGRVLQRFAFIPGLKIIAPTNSSDTQSAVFEFDWDQDSDLGNIQRASLSPSLVQTSDDNTRVFEFCTSQPFADLEWIWNDERHSSLTFRFAMQGLRWKVTGVPNFPADWTRSPIFLDPAVIAIHDAQLEIQVPPGSELEINASLYEGQLQHSASGDSLVLPLASYGESVELTYSGEKYDAVVKSKQPILNFLRGIADQESIIVEWEALNLPPKLAIIAWDPFDFQAEPISFSLSEVQTQKNQWALSDEQLPKGDFLAVSLASVLRSGFGKRSLQFAVSSKKDREPIAILVHRASGEVFSSTRHPENLQQIILALSLKRLHKLEIVPEVLFKSVNNDASRCDIDPSLFLKFCSSVESIVNVDEDSEDEQEWADTVLSLLRQKIAESFKANSSIWLKWVSQGEDRFTLLLRHGIPVGQKTPFSFLDIGRRANDHKVYPNEYIQDLWMVSATKNQSGNWQPGLEVECGFSFQDLQKQAATRILEFHRIYELPSPFEFLPLTGRLLKVTNSDCQHLHAFSVPTGGKPPKNELDFAELLGLERKSIDCNSTSQDHFFHLPISKFPRSKFRQSIERAGGKKSYSLSWVPHEEKWFIENLDETPQLCCKCDGVAMTSVCQSASDFAKRFRIRELVNGWSIGTSSNDLGHFEFLYKCNGRLFNNDYTGPIHDEVLKRPEKVRQECFGTEVYCDEFEAISDTARIAWELSWIERWIAWEGAKSLTRSHYLDFSTRSAELETKLPVALANAMERWPQLMRRCLALSEIIYWTFHRQGIGVAAKYE